MTTSHLKTVLPGPVQTVWAIVRNVQRYPDWRSDVERVETPDARTFREYTKGGYVTNFTIIISRLEGPDGAKISSDRPRDPKAPQKGFFASLFFV